MRIGHNRPPRRQQPERVMTERQIHRAVAQHLTLRGADGLIWFHPVNEGRRSPREGFTLKSLGMTRGVSDLILLRAGQFFALELKRDKSARSTLEQLAFRDAVNASGGYAAIVHGLDAALKCLVLWGLLKP
jgi:hypothetical protein